MQGHLSAQEVFGSARRPLPGLNIATVHRTLATIAAGIFGVALVFGG